MLKSVKSFSKNVKLSSYSLNYLQSLFIICFFSVFIISCEKEEIKPASDASTIITKEKLTNDKGAIQYPSSGGACTLSKPAIPFYSAGYSAKQSWHRSVNNQDQLISAINYVNRNGGTIYINASFSVTKNLPAITRNNVTILSKKAYKITDRISGSASSATQLFLVNASNFTMKNVTIRGIGISNPSNPGSWSGKRSGVVVNGNYSTFERVDIGYYTHAAIRLENGGGHQVLSSVLTNQKRSDLGYGVLLRNNANNVLIKRNYFNSNSHSVATTGGKNQSYKAVGNWSKNAFKWHFDVHMGPDNYGGAKVEILNNVTQGSSTLLLVRGPFTNGVYVKNNLHSGSAGKLVELKPDRTFSQGGTTFIAGNFYSPFGLSSTAAKVFFSKGDIRNNCVNQNNSF